MTAEQVPAEESFQDRHPQLYRYLKLLAEEYGVDGLRQALDEIDGEKS